MRDPPRRMPDELIERLFVEFKNDKIRWDEFEKREWSFVKDKVEALPGRAMIVEKFVEEKLGANHNFLEGELILKIREGIHGFNLDGSRSKRSILKKLRDLIYRLRR